MRARSVLLAAALLTLGGRAAGADGPVPPCAGPPNPAVPAVDAPPAVRVWLAEVADDTWRAPPCVGWPGAGFSALSALSARFLHGGGADTLAGRFARVSQLAGLRYWSHSFGRWREMVVDAYALSGPDPSARRADFSPGDVRSGAVLYFWQDGAFPRGSGVYRMDVVERSDDRLVIDIANVSAVGLGLFREFAPFDYQMRVTLERTAEPGVWRYYCLTRIRGVAPSLLAGERTSIVNRMAAIHRHLIGVPPTAGPPLER